MYIVSLLLFLYIFFQFNSFMGEQRENIGKTRTNGSQYQQQMENVNIRKIYVTWRDTRSNAHVSCYCKFSVCACESVCVCVWCVRAFGCMLAFPHQPKTFNHIILLHNIEWSGCNEWSVVSVNRQLNIKYYNHLPTIILLRFVPTLEHQHQHWRICICVSIAH